MPAETRVAVVVVEEMPDEDRTRTRCARGRPRARLSRPPTPSRLRRQTDTRRVGDHQLDAGRPGPPPGTAAPTFCGESGTNAVLGLRGRCGAKRPEGVGDVVPLAAPHPRHEEEARDHRVELAALQGDLVGLDAAASQPRQVARIANRTPLMEVIGRTDTPIVVKEFRPAA